MSETEIDYLEETGPGISELPEHVELPPGAEAEQPQPLYPGWDPDAVEAFVKGTGAGIHMLIGQTERDWLMTEKDLERIVPPLTRICNRWEPALKLSPVADPLLVAHGFALYGWRSALERKRAMRDAEVELAGPRAGYVHDDEDEDLAGDERGGSEISIEDLDEPSYFQNGGSDGH
jgi:hypothetical protein